MMWCSFLAAFIYCPNSLGLFFELVEYFQELNLKVTFGEQNLVQAEFPGLLPSASARAGLSLGGGVLLKLCKHLSLCRLMPRCLLDLPTDGPTAFPASEIFRAPLSWSRGRANPMHCFVVTAHKVGYELQMSFALLLPSK